MPSVSALIAAPVVAFILAVVGVPIARRMGAWLGITAEPVTGSGESPRVPVFGGPPIVAAVFVSLTITGHLELWMLFSGLALLAVGVVDDTMVLQPAQKLICQVAVAAAAVLMLPRFMLTPWPAVDYGLAVLWLIATSTAFNLIDGIDGLAAGVGVIASLALGVTGLVTGNPALSLGGLALAGALGGFLIYNFHPAAIFMGDGGALPVGFVLGLLALYGGQVSGNSRLTRYVFPLFILLIPLLDAAVVSVTRIATGSPISRRGLDHCHHRLMALGLSDRATAGVSWTIAGVGAVCAVIAGALPHPYLLSMLPFIGLAVAVVAMFTIDLTFDSSMSEAVYGQLRGIARLVLNIGYKRRIAEAGADVLLISGAYFGAYLLRLNFEINDGLMRQLMGSLPWVLAATYVAFLSTGIYHGIWRYTGLSDGIRFANAALLAGVLMAVASRVVPISVSGSILVLFVILLFNLLMATRMSFQLFRRGISRLAPSGHGVIVVGAGRTGCAAANYLSSNRDRRLELVGFVDDDVFKRGMLVQGKEVLGSVDDLERIHSTRRFDQLLIAADALGEERMARLAAFAYRHGVAIHRFEMGLNEIGRVLVMARTDAREGRRAAVGGSARGR